MAGLLDYITEAAKSQYAKGALSGLLDNPTQSLGNAYTDVKNIFNPEYMRNVQGMNAEDTKNLALDANPVMGAITAFHGSPYIFNKFNASKIGSGEGAQAYGHGLYFADSPKVAKSYVINNAKYGELKLKDGTVFNSTNYDLGELKNTAGTLVYENGNNMDKINQRLNEIKPEYLGGTKKQVLNEIKKLQKLGAVPHETGAFYKVDIPDESIPKMLDWDKKISEQHNEVLNAIGINPSVAQKYNKIVNRINELSNVKGALDSPEWNELVGQASDLRSNYGLGLTGENYYKNLAINSVRRNGENFDHNKEAATALRLQGITGIRYLDGSSRMANEGTSNYVVFDDKLPKILERISALNI